jgi:hypothetical protein
MFPLSIGQYVKLGAAAFALLFAAYLGYSYEHNRFMAFKAEVEAVAKTQEAQNISIQKQSDLVTKGIKNEYEARISALRNYYSSGLRNSSSGELSAIPQSTISIDGKATNLQLACAYTTQQLVSLQDWIKAQAGIQ